MKEKEKENQLPAPEENSGPQEETSQAATQEESPQAGPQEESVSVGSSGGARQESPEAPCVAFVVVHTEQRDDSLLLRHCLRSLRKNLRQVDSAIVVVGPRQPRWLADGNYRQADAVTPAVILDACPSEAGRIVVMTDRMHLANPVMPADIAVLKALPEPKDLDTIQLLQQLTGNTDHPWHDYDVKMPAMLLRTPLQQFSAELPADSMSCAVSAESLARLVTLYFNAVYPDVIPLRTDWKTDSWLVPVVSRSPRPAAVNEYLKYKKFIYIYPTADGPQVTALLKFLTPDRAPWETDYADPSED